MVHCLQQNAFVNKHTYFWVQSIVSTVYRPFHKLTVGSLLYNENKQELLTKASKWTNLVRVFAIHRNHWPVWNCYQVGSLHYVGNVLIGVHLKMKHTSITKKSKRFLSYEEYLVYNVGPIFLYQSGFDECCGQYHEAVFTSWRQIQIWSTKEHKYIFKTSHLKEGFKYMPTRPAGKRAHCCDTLAAQELHFCKVANKLIDMILLSRRHSHVIHTCTDPKITMKLFAKTL